MARLIPLEDTDPPEVQCDDCDVVMTIIWNRVAWTDRVLYCPFCGEEIEVDQEGSSE